MSNVYAQLGDELRPREREVLQRIADGMNRQEIARDLVLSYHTVKQLTDNARTRLGARTLAHAVALGIRGGVVK